MPRSDGASSSGREPLGRVRAVHTLGKGHCTRNTTEAGERPRVEAQGGGRGESVAGPEQGKRLARGTAERASGKRSLSPCLKQLQHAIATRGVSPLSQLRRCVRGAARSSCCVQDSTSFDGGGSRSMVPAQPHHVPLPSHALSLLAKTTVACNVVEAPVVPAHRGSRRPSHRPFPSSSRCFDCLATSSCPPTLPTAPALSLPLDTCLKTHLRHAG